MNELTDVRAVGDCVEKGLQSAMERMLLEEYLQTEGYTLADLRTLPKAQARALMVKACQYASLRLAQVESMAHLREKIRD